MMWRRVIELQSNVIWMIIIERVNGKGSAIALLLHVMDSSYMDIVMCERTDELP